MMWDHIVIRSLSRYMGSRVRAYSEPSEKPWFGLVSSSLLFFFSSFGHRSDPSSSVPTILGHMTKFPTGVTFNPRSLFGTILPQMSKSAAFVALRFTFIIPFKLLPSYLHGLSSSSISNTRGSGFINAFMTAVCCFVSFSHRFDGVNPVVKSDWDCYWWECKDSPNDFWFDMFLQQEYGVRFVDFGFVH